MTTLKTTSTVPVSASSTVTLDPGSAYQLSVTNTGTVTIGVGTNDFERAFAVQSFAFGSAALGGTAVRGNDLGFRDDGFSNTLLAPGQTRRSIRQGR